MVHGVRIADGQAKWYRNRYVRSDRVAQQAGRAGRGRAGRQRRLRREHPRHPARGQHPGAGRGRLAAVRADRGARHGRPHATSTGHCAWGTCRPATPPTRTRIPRPASCTPCPTTGCAATGWTTRCAAPTDGSGGPSPIKVGGSPMMHDFALTENYVVIYDLPVVFDKPMATRGRCRAALRIPARLMMSAIIGRNPLPDPVIARIARGAAEGDIGTLPYSWDPDYPARLGLLPREGGSDDVRWFEIDPCFVFHTLNAYEDGDTVVVDVVTHPRMFATVLNGPDEGPVDDGAVHHRPRRRQGARGRLRRPLAGVPAHRRAADRTAPPVRLLRRLRGREAPATPCSATTSPPVPPTYETSVPAARRASSASSRHEGATDGGRRGADGLRLRPRPRHERPRVLDAETLEDVAAVHLPARVPAGFHGSWNPSG